MNETKQQNHTHPVLSSLPPQRAKKGKIVSAEEAVRVIRAATPWPPAVSSGPVFRRKSPWPLNAFICSTNGPGT